MKEKKHIVLGNWTLTRLIGEGSFGKVFEAEREDFGSTYKAAVKIISIPQSQSEIKNVRNEGMSDKDVTAYFRGFVEEIVREFSLMSKLKGTANIVSYEDHSVVERKDGIGWTIIIRMELLTPLMDYIRGRHFTRKDVIKLGIDMCRALELCQKYNIIHRDIKPENIFVSELGDYKLGDFGIARTIEKTTSGMSKKGTYMYMAPEAYREGTYGSNVDIYSLGLVLFRLLNDNRAPFLPKHPLPITYNDRENALAKRISGANLPQPKNADGRLAEIVLKACEYDPKNRYSSPMQMREELEAILYTADEAPIIYPQGDETPIKSLEYIEGINSKSIAMRTVSDSTESLFGKTTKSGEVKNEDRTESAFGTSNTVVPLPPQKKIKIPAIVASAIVVLLAGIFGGFLIFGNNNNKNSDESGSVYSEDESILPLPVIMSNNSNLDEQEIPENDIEEASIYLTTNFNSALENFLTERSSLLNGESAFYLYDLDVDGVPEIIYRPSMTAYEAFHLYKYSVGEYHDMGIITHAYTIGGFYADDQEKSIGIFGSDGGSHAHYILFNGGEMETQRIGAWGHDGEWFGDGEPLDIRLLNSIPRLLSLEQRLIEAVAPLFHYESVESSPPMPTIAPTPSQTTLATQTPPSTAILPTQTLTPTPIPTIASQLSDFEFTIYNDTVTITKYVGSDREVVIPSFIENRSVTVIGYNAFFNSDVTSVIIPDSVTLIEFGAFNESSLTSVVIPDSVTSIEGYAFSKTSLSSISIPSSLTSIEVGTFWWTPLNSVTIPNSITSIGNDAFASTSLTSVAIPNSVTSIGHNAFAHTPLTSVIIPSSVTSIGMFAFGNTSLTNITIPNSVISIGSTAFSRTRLENITIPSSVISIPISYDTNKEYSYDNGYFDDIETLKSIDVDSRNPSYSSQDGVLFNKDRTILLRVPPRKTGAYSIPNEVIYIAGFAFEGSNLTVLNIPYGVTHIGNSAFMKSKLTTLTIPEGVSHIGSNAFRYSDLTRIYMPNSALNFGDNIYQYIFEPSETMQRVVVCTENSAFHEHYNRWLNSYQNVKIEFRR